MNTCSRSGNGQTEVEPCSGSSIMGYAGICSVNVQNNSDNDSLSFALINPLSAYGTPISYNSGYGADIPVSVYYFGSLGYPYSNPNYSTPLGSYFNKKNGDWVLENLTDKDHIRGALKAYRKATFKQIGRLKPAMGWDTVDELLCKFYNWKVVTDESLHVKHLKPTGASYNKAARYKQGEAFYSLGYGFFITAVASFKLAMRKGKPLLFIDYIKGFWKAKSENKTMLACAYKVVLCKFNLHSVFAVTAGSIAQISFDSSIFLPIDKIFIMCHHSAPVRLKERAACHTRILNPALQHIASARRPITRTFLICIPLWMGTRRWWPQIAVIFAMTRPA